MRPGPSGPPLWHGTAALILYHFLFICSIPVIGPILVWRMCFSPRYRAGLLARMGRLDPTPAGGRPIWIHGVSVGEIKAAATLIESLRRDLPDVELVISTTTSTGFESARMIYQQDRVIYYPVDFGFFPGRALDRINPSFILLVELEIWPNFLQAVARRDIPVAVINGRISERSYRGYRRVLHFLPQLFWVDAYFVQDGIYRDRLVALGIDPKRIAVTGNMKYDSAHLRESDLPPARLREWLAADGQLVLVAGSTHGEEDRRLAALIRSLQDRVGRTIRLVLAPRHPERVPTVSSELAAMGLKSRAWSECMDRLEVLAVDEILIVDSIGHLETFYATCDVAFVGGSMVPHGGQNMIEPAALGKAVVFGPHTTNFRKDVELLLAAEAVIQVQDWEELQRILERLLSEDETRKRLGTRAITLIEQNQGATKRTRTLLAPLLSQVGIRPVSRSEAASVGPG